MHRLRTLGAIDLRDPAGEPVAVLLQQPRRLALLVYLACARDGLLRRDHLLPRFWPELDDTRGRAALSQALHVIRRALGQAIIVTRGTEEVGVDRHLLLVDAVEFRRLAGERNWEEADRQYQGDFLPSFHLSDAPGFEEWMEETRGALREQARTGASQLLSRDEATGQSTRAIQWARRLVELAPLDEPAVRRLMQLLGDTGDRPGAIRVFEEFSQRLALELELTPDPVTIQLVERIRSQRPAPAPAPAVSPPVIAASVPAQPVPAEVASVASSSPRRLPLGWLAAVLVLLLMGTGVYRATARPRPASLPRVAVFPFVILGDTSLAYLGDGMVDLVSTKLEAVGQVRTIDPGTLLARLGREPGNPRADDPSTLASIASSLNAQLFVLGRIVGVGPRLSLSLSLYDARGERQAVVTEEAGEPGELPGTVDRAISELAATRWSAPAERLERLAVGSTTSQAALRAYLEGARLFRAGHYTEARDAFRSAIGADSLYAIAWYRLSTTGAWVGNDQDYIGGARRASELADRLSDRDRRLVRAHWAYVDRSIEESERLYRGLVAEYPDDAEAWFQLGELLFHTSAQRGQSIEAAGPAFARAEALIGGSPEALGHLISLAVLDHDVEAADSLLPRLLTAYPEHEPRRLYQRLLVAVLHGNKAVRRGILAELPREAAPLWIAAQAVGTYTDDFETVDTLAAWLMAPGNPTESRVEGLVLRIDAYLATGRWREARANALHLRDLDPVVGSEMLARCDALPWLELTGDEAARAGEGLDRWGSAPSIPMVSATGMNSALHAGMREYYIVQIARGRNDSKELVTSEERLTRMAAKDSLLRQSGLTAAVRAAALLARGDSAGALAQLELVTGGARSVLVPGQIGAAARFARADLLRRMGRPADALGWYRSFRVIFEGDFPYRAPALLGEAEALEAMGEPARARQAYNGFLDLWAGSDARFEPLLARARSRAASLGRTEAR